MIKTSIEKIGDVYVLWADGHAVLESEKNTVIKNISNILDGTDSGLDEQGNPTALYDIAEGIALSLGYAGI